MNNFFDYPLDASTLLRKKKSLKRELLKQEGFLSKKIAILGGSTTNELKNILELFLLNEGIQPEFYESEYNKFYEDIMFGAELREFNPDIIYMHTTYRNIINLPEITDTPEVVTEKLGKEFDYYQSLWAKISADFNCTIIQNNFDFPRNRSLGNLDTVKHFGITNFINRLNLKFADYAQSNSQLLINDINYLSSWIGLEKWHDLSMWFSYKYAVSYEAIPSLAKNISMIIKSIYGKTQKCLVLDLDNTMWGGIVGDDGVDNIKIGKETPVAEAYTGFQEYVKELKARGITLAIASKNDHENAIAGLNHPEMVLKEADFTNIKANWDPKSLNIEKISSEINIGLDSLVFIDDNPTEREIVSSQLPVVNVPNVGETVTEFIDHIDRNGYFESIDISNDDLKRNKYYDENKKRQEVQSKFETYADFLVSLDMVADIQGFKPTYLERITQLTNKTNQFNLTTKRYTINEIEELSKSVSNICLYGRLKDKFGDNGLVSVVIGSIKEDVLNLDLWLMSCRVLKRNLEYAMLDQLVEECKKRNIRKIDGWYYKSPKNNMVKDHYKNLGFQLVETNGEDTKWELDVLSLTEKKNNIIMLGEY
ncbi:HAD-IIIC family phosphatase [Neobacillus drentensis]|uniref:HAD-IIIC family phosphatase n=1 Tax=Neobacillus drentensis TaxID=220684 RepID=UPI002FFEA18D